MYRDIIYYITIFTDIKTTVNLSMVSKIINHVITTDNRFITFRLFYIILQEIPIQTWVNLIKTSRYNYYKIIPCNGFTFYNMEPVNANPSYREYYKALYNDNLIEHPKYYNEQYSDDYYEKKYLYENYDKTSWYVIKLDKLITYFKTNPKIKSCFHEILIKYSLTQLSSFNNGDFAKKFKILITDNKHYNTHTQIKFMYNDINVKIRYY